MKEKLQSAMKAAMKAREKEKLTTIRALISAIQYAEIEGDVDEQKCFSIFKTEIKKRKEEQEFAKKAGRDDQLEALAAEISVIETFLPQQLTEQQLVEYVEEKLKADSRPSMGELMAALKQDYPGQYDGKLASQVIKARL